MGAVVSDRAATYRVAISSSRAEERDEERMRTMLLSFRRDPGGGVPWLLGLGVAGLVTLAWRLHRARAAPPARPAVVARIEPPPPSPLRQPPR